MPEAGAEQAMTERCGQCGATVATTDELCPTCGALLAAYRAPVGSVEPVPVEIPPVEPSPVVAQPPVELLLDTPVQPETPTPELTRARSELLTVLQATEARLLTAIEAEAEAEVTEPVAVAEHPVIAPKSAPGQSAPRVPSPLPTTAPKPPEKPQPRKPGFLSIGSLEPVMLLGTTIFAAAVVIGLCSSLSLFKGGAAIAFALGAIGTVAVISALLAAVVRRDQNRRR